MTEEHQISHDSTSYQTPGKSLTAPDALSSILKELKPALPVILGALSLTLLDLTSRYSYLLFHSLAEMFSVIIACSILIIAWNARRFMDNAYFLFIGIAYLFVGGLDLLHTLSYKGMGVFTGYDANLPTQFWITARYTESIALLIAPLFLGQKLRANVVMFSYFVVVSFILGAIFYWNIFPDSFIEGEGLTPFKKISEYIISLILLGSIGVMWQRRSEFEGDVFRFIVISIILTIGAELAFTFYVSVYGFSNLLGHFLKIISFYFIYKAVILTGLNRPYDLLFRNLKQNNDALQRGRDNLGELVAARTSEIINTKKDLQKLAGRLISNQEGELRRLSRELHDDLTQQLAVMAIDTGNIIQSYKDLPASVLSDISSLKEKLITISKNVHNMSRDLHPSILEDLGLVRAIQSECRDFSTRSGIAVVFTPENVPDNIPNDISLNIYRIIQEGLSNIVKYAKTRNAYVFLEGTDHQLTLSVRDTGVGFDANEVKNKTALGLGSMRERARLANGTFSITSKPQKGTIIKVIVPLEKQ